MDGFLASSFGVDFYYPFHYTIILMIVPMHPVVILAQLTIMTFSGVINHLDIEIIYPAISYKWIIGATHHGLYHKQFKYILDCILLFRIN